MKRIAMTIAILVLLLFVGSLSSCSADQMNKETEVPTEEAATEADEKDK